MRSNVEAVTVEDAERAELLTSLLRREGLSLPIPFSSRPLVTRPRAGALPLSYAQERLWFLEQLGLVGSAYNVPAALRLAGALDLDALERSFAEVVRRHEALRTRLVIEDGAGVQVIDAPGAFRLEVIDLGGLEAEEQTAEVGRLTREHAQRRFDLTHDALLRATLLRLGAEDHVVLVNMHHIVSDAWSTGILVREIGTLYAAFRQGHPSPLAELPIQYADYALWQREWLRGDVLARQVGYWKGRLAGAPAALDLPADRPRPAVQSYAGGTVAFTLPQELSSRLAELSRREGVTLYMVLLGAFQVLLKRYSGQDDIVVGSPIAGRRRQELEGLIGFFVNTLVLRTDLSGDPGFSELLRRVKETCLGAFGHQDLPFEKLVEELSPVRDLSRQPIFQVLFVLQNVPAEALELPRLRLSRAGSEHVTSKFDLTLFVHETARGLRGSVEYAADLFDRTTIERLADHYRVLLEGIVAAPQRRLSELALLTDGERKQLLEEWNDTAAEYPRDKCLHELFAAQAARTPDAVAVVYEDRRLTYAELDTASNRLAHHLRGLGVGPEVVVGLAAERSVEMVVALLGILKAGAAYLPLDPSYPAERLAYMLADANVTVLLTQAALREQLPPHDARVVLLDTDWSAIAQQPATPPQNLTRPGNLAYVIYTSGSTGRPKGVMNSHRGIVNRLQWMQDAYNLAADDRILQKTPFSFDVSVWEFFWPLLFGARLIMARPAGHQDPAYLCEVVGREGVTIMHFVPSMLHAFLEGADTGRCASLRDTMCSGEALPVETQNAFLRRLPGRLHNLYGPTEAAVDVSAWQCTSSAGSTGVPIGRPISNIALYVVDEWLAPVPAGISGELYIGGAGLARGYLGRPELTAERFVPSPFGDGERLYRTGDLARWRADGELEYLGRIDHQVKLRGYRIELGEIEAALLRHEAVEQAVVVAREDAPGDKRLVAYVVPDTEQLKADGSDDAADVAGERVGEWETLFDATYGSTGAEGVPGFVGWNSSYTDAPIPRDEMEEWLAATIERIKALEPKRVLEIGCGVGLLVQHLAPVCESYRGTDISASAIARLRRWAGTQAGLRHVELVHGDASGFQDLEPGSVDTVILNSVVQYFPDVDYLIDVLKRAAALVAPGGRVFVGDIRHLGLLSVFHGSVQLEQAPADLAAGQLRRRIARAVADDKELVIDPEFFVALAEQLPGIGGVEVVLKRGRSDNELTRYRYDVVLHVGPGAAPRAEVQLDWRVDANTLADISAHLGERRLAGLRIAGVANRRLARDVAAAQLIGTSAAEETVGGLLGALREGAIAGEDPETFWALGEQHGYEVRIGWTSGSRDGRFDVLLFDRSRMADAIAPSTRGATDGRRKPLSGYANNPSAAVLGQQLMRRLREHAEQFLPDYMVPSAFVVLDALPLTPNGKVDRRALPAPEGRPEVGAYVAPGTPVEEALCAIWRDVLKLDRVGVTDNFFELGGHSLLATRVIARLRDVFEVELPLRALFEAPTVRELSGRIETARRDGGDVLPPLSVRPRGERLALSYAQERLWFLDQLGLVGAAYNMPAALGLEGELDVGALERSFGEVVRRHEALRTRFEVVDGTGVQVIDAPEEFRLEVIDLGGLEAGERAGEVDRLAREDAVLRFDLAAGPLVRAKLLRLGAEDHVVLVNMHHIVSDGWSMSVLIREVAALYAAFRQGRPSPLGELAIQYADYALWQREWLRGDVLARQVGYWKGRLAGAPAALDLPADRPRPAVQSYAGGTVAFTLPQELSSRLAELSRRAGVTLYMVLLGAFQVLLKRYSGQDDIVVGSPIAGRQRQELEGLIGFFVNTLVLRTDLSGDPGFSELLRRVKETCLGAYGHQDLPFEKLVEELAPVRDLSRPPIFQVGFALQNVPAEALELPGLRLSRAGGEHVTSKFDLTLFVHETADGLSGHVEYAADLFDRATIERLAGHYRVLLEGIVAAPDRRLSELEVLTAAERRQLVQEWNDTAAEYPRDKCLHELFAAQAARTPDAVALVHEDRRLTYAELDTASNRLAHHLRGLGVGPEVVVGLAAERSVEMVVALLGILKAGAAYLPLDPSYPAERLAYMLADANVTVLLTQAALREQLPPHDARVVLLDTDWSAIAQQPATPPQNLARPGNLAYVIYTSGSTGQPKGVMVRHDGVTNLLLSMSKEADLAATDIMAAVTPLSFDIAGLEIYLPLLIGARLVVLPREAALDGARLEEELRTLGVTALQGTPATWRMLLDAGWRANGHVKVLCGGEALPASMMQALSSDLTTAWNLYGPTETTIWSTAWRMKREQAVSIGRPLSNTQLYVLDADLGVTPVGVGGALYIGGAGLARGYLGRPELTAERFVPSAFGDGERLYRTGDLARWRADGELEYLGRIDHQVKLRGHRIELGEIEAALLRHEAVEQAVVVAREDAPGDKRLAAYVVGAPDAVPDAAALRSHLKQFLPDYMVPSAFVVLDALPLTPNGKVDRRALPAPEGRPEVGAYVAPGTPVEEALCAIWRDVLKLDRVGVTDNFFELGGHSLLATRVIARLRDVFEVELPLRALFEAPTVRELSGRIETARRDGGDVLPPLSVRPRGERLALSYAQERLWFLDQLGLVGAAYNMPAALGLEGELDVGALERSFGEVVRRHEALRTRFEVVDGTGVQVIDAPEEFRLEVIDLGGLEAGERAGEVDRLAREDAVLRFDLAAGPLVRAKLLRLGAEDHVVLVNMHHIVSDGWSMSVLIREVAALYAAFRQGRPSPLGELAIQYADYALWQREWLRGDVLARQVGYWKGRLAGAPAALDLPADRPRPAVQSYAGGTVAFTLPQELSSRLAELSRRAGVTLYMVLLGAFQVLLKRYSGQDDIVVGSPIAGRQRQELEGLIGFFVNTLVLRTDLSGDPGFSELLRRVKETCLGAYGHQDLPFEKLVEELAPVRDLSRPPIFQVGFALQNVPAEALELPGLRLSRAGGEHVTSKFDLTLFVHETADGLSGHVEYAADLFDRATIERLAGHYRVLLEGIVAAPDRRLSELEVLTAAERRQLVQEWNDTAAEYPRDKCLHELFAAQAARTPDAVALVHEDRRLTYAELDTASNRLAHHLRGLGVGPEVVVGLAAERSVEMVVALLGILKAGAAYLPLDPSYPAERLAYMLADANVTVLLTQAALREQLPPHDARVVLLDTDWSAIAQQPATPPQNLARPGNLAYVIYTSGSTGQPKGVMVRHDGVTNLLLSMSKEADLAATDIMAAVTPLSFDIAGLEIYLPLLIGARLVVLPREAALDGARLEEELRTLGVTALQGTPATWRMLLDAGWRANGHVKVLCGGEALPASMMQALSSDLTTAWNLYGPTETTIWSTAWRMKREQAVSIGRPLSNTQLYVLDADLGVTPVGVGGALYIGGAGLARGYLGRPELTAERFVPSAFGDGERLYRTGDLARWRADGELEYLGRIDHQVKLRGHRIELGEIEAALLRHEAVEQAVVVAREDAPGDKRLAAYVVGAPDAVPDAAALRSHLKQFLPDYMVPSAFVVLDALPLTPNGKVDRRALPAPEGRPEVGAYVAPGTPVEEALCAIWRDVLKLDRVGVTDNFFELGGHSLLATRVIARLRDVFEVELPLRALFEAPTVRELSGRIETARRDGGDVLPPLSVRPRGERLALSYAQERLWFLDQLGLVGAAYNMPAALGLEGELDVGALERSFGEVVRRHEALRTRFEVVDGTGVQVIDAPEEFRLEVIDLGGLEAGERAGEVDRLAREDAVLRFDLAAGPLVRAKLLRLGAEDHVVLVNMHHIVSDGWSMSVLIREVAALYAAFRQGRPSPLGELAIQYADYALWQREWLRGDVLARQVGYWKGRLAGAPAALDLPADRPRPAVQSYAGGTVAFTLPQELSSRLAELSRRAGVTLYMVLLGAFQVLLKRYSGQDDIVVGSPIAGRQRQELEGLIGFFVNTLVLRTDLSGDPGFSELLRRVKETCLGAYGHQDLPFEKLVEELAPVRDLSRPPIFQVGFALQNVPAEALELPGLRLSRAGGEHVTSKFDLTLFVHETADGLSGHVEYAADLFDRATIERLAGHYRVLLEGIVAAPDRRLSELEVLTAAERRQLVQEWNDTAAEYPRDKCLHELFAAQAARTPDAVALVHEDRRLTYAELDTASNRLAHHLRGLGVGPEVVVGLAAERSVEMVVALLGILKAGAAYLPLDPSYPAERLAYMLADANVTVLLTQAALREQLPPHDARVVLLDTDWSVIAQQPATPPQNLARPGNLAYVIYTSGSTGQPKGVMVRHGGVTNYVRHGAAAYDVASRPEALVNTPLSFDATVTSLLVPLMCGQTVRLMPEQHEIQALAEVLAGSKDSLLLKLTPAHLDALRSLVPTSALGGREHTFVVGGEELPVSFVRPWREHAPKTRIFNEYGPTETVVGCTTYELNPTSPQAGAVPIGRPISNTQVYVLDADLGAAPLGIPGELYIGGIGLARGYLGRPELTAERFVPSPFGDGERLYRTGDLARWRADGELEYLGRIDHQVKLRGYRIELGEIEAALLRHEAVEQAVVVAREDAPGDKRLVAYVVPDTEQLKADGSDDAADVAGERVGEWETLFDATYGSTGAEGVPGFVGWNSSYTDAPIPRDEMEEWLAATIERIKALEPKRVLEIGCGVGLLVQHLAPVCESYRGTDISASAIARLRRWAGTQAGLRHVELVHGDASGFQDLEPGSVDTVILNSVVQYFPDVDYLIDVLKRAAALVAPGGRVFVGDIRHLGLLSVFHGSVQLEQAPADLAAGQLRRRIARAVADDKELVIDPEFFVALAEQLPGIGGVEVVLKRGRSDNELTRYRYDVVLHVGPGAAPRAEVQLDWRVDANTLADISAHLGERRLAGLRIAGVANRRLARDVAAAQLIGTSAAEETVGGLLGALREGAIAGEDPETFWALGEQHGYEVRIGWTSGSRDGRFDVLLFDRSRMADAIAPSTRGATDGRRKPLSGYANNPSAAVLGQQLMRRLREHAEQFLPDYMVPSAFVVLDALPLTPNGKVDRRALPAPEGRPEVGAYVAPGTPVEEALCAIWRDVLKLDRVGVTDNFFELGGHSLLATRVIARLRDVFEVELPLRALFEAPTVRELSGRIETARRDGGDVLPPLSVRPRGERLALSYAQERLWFLDQLGLVGAAYNMPAALGLEGELDVGALERSFGEVVRRHEALRTRFEVVDGTGVQVIDAPEEFRLEVIDLGGLEAGERAGEVDRLAREDAVLRFDLAAGPLVRAKLLRLGAEDHVVLVNMHHIVSDGWSMSVLIREVAALYAAFRQGRPSPLGELAIQYADYALWQREWLRGDVLARQVGYWKGRLAGAPAALDLPADRPRPAVQSYAGGTVAFTLPQELSSRLAELSRRAGVTLYMVLLGAFQVLLKRYSSKDDIVVGSPIAGRQRQELEGLIGFFVNTLVLRTDLSGDPGFSELLRRVKETCLGAYGHQDLPFEKLVEELAPVRDLSRPPIFQVGFALQNVPAEALELPGLRLSRAGGEHVTSKFDLTLFVHETADGLSGHVEYAADLFDRATIERLAGHYRVLLEGIVAAPDRRLSELEVLTAAERRQLVQEWNDTAAEYPRDKCLHELFAAQAARTPDAVALVHEDRRLTYAELDTASNRLAHHLRGLGVGPEVVVGLAAERSVEMVVALLGILKAGAAYLPLDPSYPAERLAYMLADANVTVLLTQAALREQLPPHDARVVLLDTDWSAIAQQPATPPQNLTRPGNLAYVIYTSGSTGKPKGAMVTHACVARLLTATQAWFDFGPDDVWTLFHSYAFDFSVWELWGALACGGRIVVVPFAVSRAPDAFHDLLCREGVTVLNQTPSAFDGLSQVSVKSERAMKLRLVIFGGEALSLPGLKPWFDRHGDEQPRLINMYGITETTVHVTYRALRRSDLAQNLGNVIGGPIPDLRAYVLDGEQALIPIGIPGELYIGGAGLARGYLGRPELTAERFVPSPFGDGERLYRTGDLARWRADRELEYLGRIDHQVKLRGHRIELGEIEAALLRHETVEQAVVVAREDTPGDKRLAAYVVGAPDAAPDAAALRAHLKRDLPDYMIPSAFVALNTLPLTPNGKVDRRALPAPEGRPEVGTYVAPRSEMEEIIAGIWADLLKIEKVGVFDNFFEIGGHSLLAMQLILRVRAAFGVDLALRTLFEGSSNIADMVSQIRLSKAAEHGYEAHPTWLRAQNKSTDFSCIIPVQTGIDQPPLFCVHPIGGGILCYRELASHLGPAHPVYGIKALGLHGERDPLTSIEKMAEHHLGRLLEIQNSGPFFIIGWSAGGLIAFEIARQLEERHQTVGLVGLIDTFPPLSSGQWRGFDVERTEWLNFLNIMEIPVDPKMLSKHHSFWKQPEEQKQETILAVAKANGVMPSGLTGDEFTTMVRVFQANLRALQHYRASPIRSRTVLFQATNPRVRSMVSKLLMRRALSGAVRFWERHSTGCELVNVPGDHMSIMTAPAISVIAERLRKEIAGDERYAASA